MIIFRIILLTSDKGIYIYMSLVKCRFIEILDYLSVILIWEVKLVTIALDTLRDQRAVLVRIEEDWQ